MHPEVVLVNEMIVFDIILPFIAWATLVLKRDIRLFEAFVMPIIGLVVPSHRIWNALSQAPVDVSSQGLSSNRIDTV